MSSTFDSTVAGARTMTVSGPAAMDAPIARPSAGPALAAGTRIGEFEIVRLIGEGGFGIVYLALDRSLQREVAIKEFLPSSLATREAGSDRVVARSPQHRETFDAGLRSFVNEARLLARFDHPSLVKVLRFWEGNGTAYMAMPHYRGPTLRHSLLAAAAKPSEADLLGWLHPLLDALDVLHQARCFHRDIAPDNILLTDRGPVLLDFGAARHVIGDITQALTVVLKPSFAPIEQYGHSTSAGQGPWTDLYALGCVLHFAIVGKAPLTSVERVLFDGLEPLSQSAEGRYSASLLAAIDAALALRPQDRPQDVAAFRRMLLRTDAPSENIDLPLPIEASPPEAAPVVAAPTATAPAFAAPTGAAPALFATTETETKTAPPPAAPVVEAPPAAEPPRPPQATAATAATFATAPATTPAGKRLTAIAALAVIAMVAATVAIGWALRERVRPLPFTLPATSTPETSPETSPVPVPVPVQAIPAPVQPDQTQPPLAAEPQPAASAAAPTTGVATDAASTPLPDAAPTLPAAEPQPSPEVPTRSRSSSRIAAPRPETGSSAATEAPVPQSRAAAGVPVDTAPRDGSRCAEILEKASLGALGADDAASLKKECR